MEGKLVRYIEFLRPGIIVCETEIRVCKPEEYEHPDEVEMPGGTVGYRFYERYQAVKDGVVLRSEPQNHTGWRYLGRELNVEQVMKLGGEYNTLKSNVSINGIKRIVITPFDNAYPLDEKDVVLK